MKRNIYKPGKKVKSLLVAASLLTFGSLSAQNVFDDVIVGSANHTYLEAALIQENLDDDLQDGVALTVFAPTDEAFTALATALNTDIAGLLELENLEDILKYHVLGQQVSSSDVTNGLIANPLSGTNTLKLTKTTTGDVYVNQAMVTTADIDGGNGYVHVIDAVVLPNETVVDVAIDNGFSTLTTAVVTAELLPTLTNPLAELTVFAPTNDAFTAIATGLGTDINGLLELDNLADILKYHVLGSKVMAADINNGDIVDAVSTTNTLKLTKTAEGVIYVNQAMFDGTLNNLDGGNGYVHVIDAVVLPNETVVDVAIDNGFTTLTTAVVTAELLPTLTNPLAELTVFAPTNDAFDNLATALGTDLDGILAREDLADILTYHVLGSKVMANQITEGLEATTIQGQSVIFSLESGVTINNINISGTDNDGGNGYVHIIDGVLIPAANDETTALSDAYISDVLNVYPNPSQGVVNIQGVDNISSISIANSVGSEVLRLEGNTSTININQLSAGLYFLTVLSEDQKYLVKITVQ